MTTTAVAAPFDPVRYKETTRSQWEVAARAWNDWAPFLRSWLGPATETMLDMAAIGRGQRVLDVAAGAGDQTLDIARRVGPDGRVLATDIAAGILLFAEENARRAGYRNVDTATMDGEDLSVPDGSFDAVVSRLGLIYFPDKQKALTAMRRALRPGGRVAAIVYSTPQANPFFSIPVSVIRRRAALPAPAPGQPGPFSLGTVDVLEASLRSAGFRDVECRVLPAPLRMASAAECVRFEKESFGALHQMLAGLDEAGREAAWREIEEQLSAFDSGKGFEGPCELLVAVGVK
jgi:SAM-dependent methyltransferase